MLGLGGVVLKLKILTFLCWDLVWFEVENLDVPCGAWRCGLKLRIEVEHVDGLSGDLAVWF